MTQEQVIFKFGGMMSPVGPHPTHEDTFGRGGFVAITADAAPGNINEFLGEKIPFLRRKVGMTVHVLFNDSSSAYYKCLNIGNATNDNGQWENTTFTLKSGDVMTGSLTAPSIHANFISGTNSNFTGSLTSSNIHGNFISGTNANFTGSLTASAIHSTGNLSGITVTGTNANFTGSLTSSNIHGNFISGTNANFTGSLTAGNIRSNGNLSGITVTGTNANFTGSLTAGNIRSNGNLSGITVTGTNANFTGSLTAGVSFIGASPTANQKNKYSTDNNVYFVPNTLGIGANAKIVSVGHNQDIYQSIFATANAGWNANPPITPSLTSGFGLNFAVRGKSHFWDDTVIWKAFRHSGATAFHDREFITKKYLNDNINILPEKPTSQDSANASGAVLTALQEKWLNHADLSETWFLTSTVGGLPHAGNLQDGTTNRRAVRFYSWKMLAMKPPFNISVLFRGNPQAIQSGDRSYSFQGNRSGTRRIFNAFNDYDSNSKGLFIVYKNTTGAPTAEALSNTDNSQTPPFIGTNTIGFVDENVATNSYFNNCPVLMLSVFGSPAVNHVYLSIKPLKP
jgi:hypothetical protein